MGSIIAVGSIIALIVGFVIYLGARQKADQSTGAKLEAAKVDAAEVTAMQAILQASASAPDTLAKARDRMMDGSA